jgi:hypothetical protein
MDAVEKAAIGGLPITDGLKSSLRAAIRTTSPNHQHLLSRHTEYILRERRRGSELKGTSNVRRPALKLLIDFGVEESSGGIIAIGIRWIGCERGLEVVNVVTANDELGSVQGIWTGPAGRSYTLPFTRKSSAISEDVSRWPS